MFGKKKFIVILASLIIFGDVLYAWGPPGPPPGAGAFVAGAAVGAAVTYGVMKRKRRHTYKRRRAHRKRHVRKKHTKRHIAPTMTVEKKIQKSLTALGFYRGKIDGEVNSYETRSAIKAMNTSYELGNSASLDLKTKDALIYLGDLFIFDRLLIAKDHDQKSKNKKIQTALKIQGFYHDKIDGVIGVGTRKIITEYKESKKLSSSTGLDFEEEYQLISSAKQLNDKNIDETIASLKGSSPSKNTLLGQQVNSIPNTNSSMPNPVNNTNQVSSDNQLQQHSVVTPKQQINPASNPVGNTQQSNEKTTLKSLADQKPANNSLPQQQNSIATSNQ
jgi:hypothetical protein